VPHVLVALGTDVTDVLLRLLVHHHTEILAQSVDELHTTVLDEILRPGHCLEQYVDAGGEVVVLVQDQLVDGIQQASYLLYVRLKFVREVFHVGLEVEVLVLKVDDRLLEALGGYGFGQIVIPIRQRVQTDWSKLAAQDLCVEGAVIVCQFIVPHIINFWLFARGESMTKC